MGKEFIRKVLSLVRVRPGSARYVQCDNNEVPKSDSSTPGISCALGILFSLLVFCLNLGYSDQLFIFPKSYQDYSLGVAA